MPDPRSFFSDDWTAASSTLLLRYPCACGTPHRLIPAGCDCRDHWTGGCQQIIHALAPVTSDNETHAQGRSPDRGVQRERLEHRPNRTRLLMEDDNIAGMNNKTGSPAHGCR